MLSAIGAPASHFSPNSPKLLASLIRRFSRCFSMAGDRPSASSLSVSGAFADTVSLLRAGMRLEPIVLWISKSKAVVDQTFANFEAGGKYEHLIPQLTTGYLSEAKVDQIQDDTQACILLATVGSFNQKSKGDGKLKVHQKDEDENDGALWEILAERKAPGASERRPLIIVYDEAHNLSDQQTDLLLELEPDIILAASATMRTPGKLGQIIDRLKQVGWNADTCSLDIPKPSRRLTGPIQNLKHA